MTIALLPAYLVGMETLEINGRGESSAFNSRVLPKLQVMSIQAPSSPPPRLNAFREEYGDPPPPDISRKITACVSCRKHKVGDFATYFHQRLIRDTFRSNAISKLPEYPALDARSVVCLVLLRRVCRCCLKTTPRELSGLEIVCRIKWAADGKTVSTLKLVGLALA